MGIGKTRSIPTLAVTDIKKARDFYGDVLGFEAIDSSATGDDGALFRVGDDSYVFVYERPTPSGSTATACSFVVKDVEGTVARLRKQGVRFEDYDIPEMDLKTENGIAKMGDTKTAWFLDPFGNILALDDSLYTLAQQGRTERTGVGDEGLHA